MAFEQYLSAQMELHKSIQFQDMVKLCFQAAYGAEHLISDKSRAEAVLTEEFKNVQAADIPLFEEISEDIIRVNLAAWKFRKLPPQWLLNIFLSSTEENTDGNALMENYLEECRKKLDKKEWDSFIEEYKKTGFHPVHHSDYYREHEKPSYRIANKRFARVFPILEAVSKMESKPCVIAIDGRAASGKTTLAKDLALILGCDTVHMDDFFLPLELRTEERLNEPGGNIDYDRFKIEVIDNIRTENDFSYRVFSCDNMDFSGTRDIRSSNYRIVEGVYSLHPKFGNYADFCVFSDIDAHNQMERLKLRNGIKLANKFATSWIPMEEKYFDEFKISEKCMIYK